ncbi:MAG TPA: beta-propeller domain-containing protein [Polyangiaceae bacterium]|nr:beta-propeller domain-containing protein [Polyangiaceae bacterium]
MSRSTRHGRWWRGRALALGATAASCCALTGCCTAVESGDDAAPMMANGVATVDPTPAEMPDSPLTIEESDLVKLEGDRLYVHNAARGLQVIDVSEPATPQAVAAVADTAGASGELYVRDDHVALIVGAPATACPGGAASALVEITQASTAPRAGEPLCLAGEIVASRVVGDVLYLVEVDPTPYAGLTTLRSFWFRPDVVFSAIDTLAVSGTGVEVHVTDRTIYLTRANAADGARTVVQAFDISAGDGSIVERGTVDVEGAPMGRFHMDESGDTFRIVTRDGDGGANLTVLDVSDLGAPAVLSTLREIAPGEELFATRFVGDRAYLVTYRPELIVNTRQVWPGFDPLWVVSLEDPSRPVVLGELEIPGWSDYIFPRGDLLLAVGRGDGGEGIAASLFDVADPSAPAELRRLEFGNATASSEANTDFRGVTVVEEALGAPPLLVVPYSDNLMDGWGCRPEHHVQLVDVLDRDLALRADLSLTGRVRRTLPVGEHLYVIDEKLVTAVDVTDRDEPAFSGRVPVGDVEGADPCVIPAPAPVEQVWQTVWMEPEEFPDGHQFPDLCACSTSTQPSDCLGERAPLWVLLGLMGVVARGRLRRRAT